MSNAEFRMPNSEFSTSRGHIRQPLQPLMDMLVDQIAVINPALGVAAPHVPGHGMGQHLV
jgi:hypothetical protein